MIERYCASEMSRVCSDENKFKKWLKVEEVIIQAKVEMEILPQEALRIIGEGHFFPDKFLSIEGDVLELLSKISQEGRISSDLFQRLSKAVSEILSVEQIREIEEITRHDLLAFVQAVQESLPMELRRYFHADVTSFDIEEPAFSLLIIEATKLIFKGMDDLATVLLEKAKAYRHLTRMERSHTRHAEPNTLGLVFLGWYDALSRQKIYLLPAFDQMKFSKISGAVGTYPRNLSLELEAKVLASLGLRPARFSSQIVLRDRHSQLINCLAVLAGVVEHIALNIRLLAQQEIDELNEPFGEGQKGSSAMPHKRNPVLAENLCGLTRTVRHLAGIASENIPTWGARDISHSSPERIIFPDCFQLIYFALCRLKKVIEGIVVNEENIRRNLNMTNGVIFSPEVKDLLMAEGIEPELAYRIAQECAFEAISQNRPYLVVLGEDERVPMHIMKNGRLQDLFDMKNKLKHIDEIFARFNL
jgi:adenylosuccinate lyase